MLVVVLQELPQHSIEATDAKAYLPESWNRVASQVGAASGASAYDALNPTYAPFLTYGPLHLRLGAELTDPAHRKASYTSGSNAMDAQLTRGGYIQPLFPTTERSVPGYLRRWQ